MVCVRVEPIFEGVELNDDDRVLGSAVAGGVRMAQKLGSCSPEDVVPAPP